MLLFLLRARHIGNEKEGCFVIALSVPIIFSTGCWWSARFIKKDLDTVSFTSGVSDTFMVNRFGNSSSSSFLKLLLFYFFAIPKKTILFIFIMYVCFRYRKVSFPCSSLSWICMYMWNTNTIYYLPFRFPLQTFHHHRVAKTRQNSRMLYLFLVRSTDIPTRKNVWRLSDGRSPP